MKFAKERQNIEDVQSFRFLEKFGSLERFGDLWLSIQQTDEAIRNAPVSTWSLSSDDSDDTTVDSRATKRPKESASEKSTKRKSDSMFSRLREKMSNSSRRPLSPHTISGKSTDSPSEDVEVHVNISYNRPFCFQDAVSIKPIGLTTRIESSSGLVLEVANQKATISMKQGNIVEVAWLTPEHPPSHSPTAKLIIQPGCAYKVCNVEDVRKEPQNPQSTIVETLYMLLRLDGPYRVRWNHTKKVVIVQNISGYPLELLDRALSLADSLHHSSMRVVVPEGP